MSKQAAAEVLVVASAVEVGTAPGLRPVIGEDTSAADGLILAIAPEPTADGVLGVTTGETAGVAAGVEGVPAGVAAGVAAGVEGVAAEVAAGMVATPLEGVEAEVRGGGEPAGVPESGSPLGAPEVAGDVLEGMPGAAPDGVGKELTEGPNRGMGVENVVKRGFGKETEGDDACSIAGEAAGAAVRLGDVVTGVVT